MLDTLRTFRQWVVCRADKVPLNPFTGKTASVTDASTWSDYDTAVSCISPTNDLILGFVLTSSDPLSCIDLDNPEDPKHKLTAEEIAKAHTLHQQIFHQFNSYSERSPSGKGLHIWVVGTVPTNKKNSKACVEIYSHSRFITITGWSHHAVPIADRNSLLNSLWEQMGGTKPVEPTSIIDGPETLDDWAICNKAAQGANGNGELFQRLYQGQYEGQTQSEADLSLCNIIAFYTDSREQVGRIFRASALGQRKKAQRDDYLFHETWGIVTKAFDRKGPMLADIQNCIVESKQREEESQDEIDSDEPTPVDWMKLAPPGLMGEVANFIYKNAYNPMPEVAVAASIAYIAGICGRSWNYSNTGLNQYIILLAETGQGKEAAAQGMDRLTHEVIKTMPAFGAFIGSAGIASAEALLKQLSETPCFLSHKGEFGMWLQKITGKYARQNEINLRGMLLDLYTKSGYTQTLRGNIYSDRSKNVPNIPSPAFTLFGDSTQQEFYKALDEDNIGEGLVSRFTTIQCNASRPSFNSNHGKTPIDPEMITKIKRLADLAFQLEKLAPITVQETPDAHKSQHDYREECLDKLWSDNQSPIGKIWSRAHLRVLRIAALAAVSRCPDMPMVELEDIEWAKVIVTHSVEVIAHKFRQGEVGQKLNLNLEQRVVMGRLIRKYCHSTYNEKWMKLYGIDKPMFEARVVTNRYLQANVSNVACYRNDKFPLLAYKNIVQSFIEDGNLSKFDLSKTAGSRRQGTAFYVTDLTGLAK